METSYEKCPTSRIQAASPLMFESDEDFSDREGCVNSSKLGSESTCESIASFVEPSKEEKLLKSLQIVLSGIPPPPAFTVPQLDSREILKLWRDHQCYKLTISPNKGKQESAIKLETEAKITAWPEIKELDHWDIYYNKSSVSEEVARLSMRYKERYVGAETSSCINALFVKSPVRTASARKRARTRAWGHSPGRRLSHLARRRKAFSSANLCSVAGNNNPDKKMIMVEIKKIGNRQNKKGSTKKTKPTPKKKKDVQTNTYKRALFQSPDQQPGAKEAQTPNIQRSKRNLFSDSSEKKINENGKRERPVPKRVSPRKRVNRSLSFQESNQTARLQTRIGPTLQNSSQLHTSQLTLTGAHKQKMLWAATNALRDEGMGMNHDLFRPSMSVLFKACQRLWLSQVSKQGGLEGSTSENMLALTKRFSAYTIKQISADPTSEHMALVCANIIHMVEQQPKDQPSTCRQLNPSSSIKENNIECNRKIQTLNSTRAMNNYDLSEHVPDTVQNKVESQLKHLKQTPVKTSPGKNTPRSQGKIRRSTRKHSLYDGASKVASDANNKYADSISSEINQKPTVKNVTPAKTTPQDKFKRSARKISLFSEPAMSSDTNCEAVNSSVASTNLNKQTPDKVTSTPVKNIQESLRRSARKLSIISEPSTSSCKVNPCVSVPNCQKLTPAKFSNGTPNNNIQDKIRRSARKCSLLSDSPNLICCNDLEQINTFPHEVNINKQTPNKFSPVKNTHLELKKSTIKCSLFSEHLEPTCDSKNYESNLQKFSQSKDKFQTKDYKQDSKMISTIPQNSERNCCKQTPLADSAQSSPQESCRITRRTSCHEAKYVPVNSPLLKRSSKKNKTCLKQNKDVMDTPSSPGITSPKQPKNTPTATMKAVRSHECDSNSGSIEFAVKPSFVCLGTPVTRLLSNDLSKPNPFKIIDRQPSRTCTATAHEPAKSSLMSPEFADSEHIIQTTLSYNSVIKIEDLVETNKENLSNGRLKNDLFDKNKKNENISSQRCLSSVENNPLPLLPTDEPINRTMQLYRLSNIGGENLGTEDSEPTDYVLPPKLVPHWEQEHESKEEFVTKHSPPTLVPHWQGASNGPKSTLPDSIMAHWQQLSNNANTSDKIMFDFEDTSYEINFPVNKEEDSRASSICAPFDYSNLVDDSKSGFNSVFRRFNSSALDD